MKKLSTMLHYKVGRELVTALWRYIGRPMARIAGAIVVVIVIVQAESWAIRQGPLLLSAADANALASSDDCIPAYSTDAGALPVSILY
jgi:hypothetical protein